MTVTGRMSVNGSILDRGSIVITDRAGDAQAHLAGVDADLQPRPRPGARASGILYVTGSAVTVQVTSSRMSFSIAGNGRARLLGSGTYRLNADPERSLVAGLDPGRPPLLQRPGTQHMTTPWTPSP